MWLLKNLFCSPTIRKMDYVAAMAEMANESERTHRGMIDVYNIDIESGLLKTLSRHTASPTGRGIFKARVFGAAFIALAFSKSAAKNVEEVEVMFRLTTGVGLDSLQGSSEVRLDRLEATSFAIEYLARLVKDLDRAFKAEPFVPGAANPEYLALCEHLHDALAESIGFERYSDVVKERFAVMIQGNAGLAMNHAIRWIV